VCTDGVCASNRPLAAATTVNSFAESVHSIDCNKAA